MSLSGIAALVAACGPSAPTAAPGGSTPASLTPAAKPTGASTQVPAAAATAAPAATKRSTELRFALASEPNTLDPHLTVGRNSQIFVVNIYDGLSARDDKANGIPGLATEWKVLENPSTWQFKLRQGVKFHNGDSFDAESVKFTIERAINPETKSTIGSELSSLAGADIVDPYTITVRTKQPDILLPYRLGELFGGMLSPNVARSADAATLGTKPVGTGPFKLVEWVKNERLVLEAFDGYWRGPASIQRITVRPILEDAARIAALQAGEVDFISNVPYQRISELEKDPNLIVKTVSTPRIFFVAIDPRQKPFDDVRVRQALNYAVDVESIIKTLFLGHAKRLATNVDTTALGYDGSVQPYPFDPTKAKQLLSDAGYPDGFDTEFDAFTGSIADHSKPAEAVAEFLRKVGVRAKLNMFEFGAFGPRRVADQMSPLHIYSLGDTYFEPSWVEEWMMQDKLGFHYRNQDVLALCATADATFDPEQRKALYADVQKKMKEDAGFIFLLQNDAVFAMNKKVQYEPRPDETQWLYPARMTA